jgi:tripartite-type tricarboxylate transporter receptor subunit TctC
MRTMLAVATATLLLPSLSLAQAFPAKPIRIVVGFAPGGSNDAVARILGARMGTTLKQSMVIDNRPGANGIVAAEHVMRSPADGYTVILTGVSTLVLNPLLYPKVPYDTLTDLAPVTLVGATPQILVAHPQLPVRTLSDVVALARRKPQELTTAIPGVGGISHLTLEMFKSGAQVAIENVNYKGTGPALVDVLGGQVPMLISDLPAPLPHVKTGKLRAVMVTGAQRSTLLPDVATAQEQGFPALQATNWLGVMAPGRTPPEAIAALHEAFVAAVQAPDTRERYATIGVDPATSPTSAAFGTFVREEFVRWTQVIKQGAIKLNL